MGESESTGLWDTGNMDLYKARGGRVADLDGTTEVTSSSK